MKRQKAEKLLIKTQADYDLIAEHFSGTRQWLWSEMKDWKKYLKEGQKILDVGCGNGRLLELLKDRKVEYFGIDFSPELISVAKKECKKYSLPKINFQVANLLSLPFPDNNFDLVFCVATFHHVPSVELRWRAVKEMQRVLKPGGTLFLNNWYFWNKYSNKKYLIKKQLLVNWLKGLEKGGLYIPWKDKDGKVVTNRYYYAFKKREMRTLLQKQGFQVLENKIVSHSPDQRVEETGFESLVTIARKPN